MKNSDNKSGIILILIAICIGIIVCIFGWGPTLLVGFIFILIFGFISSKKLKRDNRILAERKEKEKKQKELDDLRFKIYKKCKENNLSSFESKEDKEALMIIASTYGIESFDEAKDMYYEAKKKIKNDKIKKAEKERQDKISSCRESDLMHYNSEKEDAEQLKGKNKYTYSLKKDLEYAKKTLQLSKSAEKIGINNMTATAKKADPYIWAGIANGMGGLGAAMLTASDIEKSNIESENNVKRVREQGAELYSSALQVQRTMPVVIDKEEKMIQSFENKLFDDKNQDEKFKLFDFKKISYSINIAENFEITCEYEVKKDIKILNSPAVLDGTLQFNVYDSNNEIVATGLYNALGKSNFELKQGGQDFFNSSFNLNYTGFKNDKINVICITKESYKINQDEKYTIQIYPYYLWIIEK